MKVQETGIVVSQKKLADGIYSLWVKTEQIAKEAKAGQFVSLYCKDAQRLLPRPISICEINREEGTMRFVYRVAGKGTEEFSGYRTGDAITLLGPLGNGFEKREKSGMLIAGGIGIPPMLQLAKELKETGAEVTAVVGYRDSHTFLADELKKVAKVYIATEDGSVGSRGNVMNAIADHSLSAEVIYACGPKLMLRAIKEFGEKEGVETQISLEEKMACGIGACLACVCKTVEIDDHSQVHNARICKDGPVFEAGKVDLS